MIERIKDVQPASALALIKQSQCPTVLYGASQAAELNYDYLVKHGINLDAVVVDGEFLSETENKILRGQTVQAIEEFIDKCDNPVNVIIGFYSNNIKEMATRKLASLAQRGLNLGSVVLLDHHVLMYPSRAFTFQFIQDNLDAFDWTYDLWADDRSRDVMVAFINQRISMQIGDLESVGDDNQYFLSSVVHLKDHETYVDCGAYDGDTVFEFIQAVKAQTGRYEYNKIYALECNPASYPLLVEKVGHLPNIVCLDEGAWDREATLSLQCDLKRSSHLAENGNASVRVRRIDDILSAEDGCSFIKMDIEGAELPALQGAETTIKKYLPKLAICVYHKNDDLLTIPQYLYALNPNYKFYLRAHESKSGEIVLYAV